MTVDTEQDYSDGFLLLDDVPEYKEPEYKEPDPLDVTNHAFANGHELIPVSEGFVDPQNLKPVSREEMSIAKNIGEVLFLERVAGRNPEALLAKSSPNAEMYEVFDAAKKPLPKMDSRPHVYSGAAEEAGFKPLQIEPRPFAIPLDVAELRKAVEMTRGGIEIQSGTASSSVYTEIPATKNLATEGNDKGLALAPMPVETDITR